MISLKNTQRNNAQKNLRSVPPPCWGEVRWGAEGGMLMPGRSYSSDKYRFGMNGQEKDDEIAGNGNIYSALDWEYDARSLHRWNIDPETGEYPGQSPYACFNGNPILYADPTGQSGEATIDKNTKTITVSSTFIFYGSQATIKTASAAANEIADQWNRAGGTVSIEGQIYKVQFKIHYQVVSDAKAEQMAKGNKNIQNNFVRIEDNNESSFYGTTTGENAGVFEIRDRLGSSTTAAHEAGHGWGLEEGADESGTTDLRGTGQPGVMEQRGTKVDAPYTYSPKKGNSTNDGKNTVDPSKRRVSNVEVGRIFTKSVISKLIKTGKADLGRTTNKIYKKDATLKR